MKNKIIHIILLLTIIILVPGCSKKESNTWQDETNYGDINIEAEVVDTNDFDVEYEIDKYINFEEINSFDKNRLTNDNYRIYYNRVANQTGMNLLNLVGVQPEDKNGYLLYDASYDAVGNYLYNNKDEKGNIYLKMIISEININTSGTEEEYNQSIAKLMAPIHGGVPYLKKFDLNEIFVDMRDTFKNNEVSNYNKVFNGININAKREYNWVTITIKIN